MTTTTPAELAEDDPQRITDAEAAADAAATHVAELEDQARQGTDVRTKLRAARETAEQLAFAVTGVRRRVAAAREATRADRLGAIADRLDALYVDDLDGLVATARAAVDALAGALADHHGRVLVEVQAARALGAPEIAGAGVPTEAPHGVALGGDTISARGRVHQPGPYDHRGEAVRLVTATETPGPLNGRLVGVYRAPAPQLSSDELEAAALADYADRDEQRRTRQAENLAAMERADAEDKARASDHITAARKAGLR